MTAINHRRTSLALRVYTAFFALCIAACVGLILVQHPAAGDAAPTKRPFKVAAIPTLLPESAFAANADTLHFDPTANIAEPSRQVEKDRSIPDHLKTRIEPNLEGNGALPELLPHATLIENLNHWRTKKHELITIAQLLDDGNLVWPTRGNALARLRQLLEAQEDDPLTERLRERATSMLLVVARDLFVEGYRYDARNLVEEVLTFAPHDNRAKQMHKEFRKESERFPGTRTFVSPYASTTTQSQANTSDSLGHANVTKLNAS
jgi:hypothetical protein